MRAEIGKGRNNNKGSFDTNYLEVDEYRISEYQLEIKKRSCFYEYMIDSESDYFSVMENIMDNL